MNDGELLLKAILLNPDEDTPRLAYADWLQENGQEDRAEFIRVGVKIAVLEASAPPKITIDSTPRRCRKCKQFWAGTGSCGCSIGDSRRDVIRQKIRDRAAWGMELKQAQVRDQELWDIHAREWFPLLNKFRMGATRRGFVDSLECKWEDWRDHADAILAAHPIREVKLTTLPPEELVRYDRDSFEYDVAEWLKVKWPKIKFHPPLRGRTAHAIIIDEFAGSPLVEPIDAEDIQ